jgi:hypothetical protein
MQELSEGGAAQITMIITKLYGGKVVIKFDEEKHRYLVNGKRTESVTRFLGSIAKPALIPWAVKKTIEHVRIHLDDLTSGKVTIDKFNTNEILYGASKAADQARDKAAEIGTAIHFWVEQHIKRQAPEMPDDPVILNGVNAFLRWKEEHKVKLLKSEKIIYSKKYDYSGIIDIIAEIDGKPYIVDIKTSNGIYDEMKLQVAAYMQAEQEESGKKYAGRWIIRLGKDLDGDGNPDFEAVYLDYEKDAFKKDFAAFVNIMEFYRWQQSQRLDSFF